MLDDDILYWLKWDWFADYFKANNYEFERPWIQGLLYFIPLILIIRFFYVQFFSGKMKTAQVDSKFRVDPTVLFGLIPPVLFVISIEFILMALSGPQKVNEKVETWTEGIDIMIAIDISYSMKGMDLKPNRLESAKRIASQFIDGREGDRIGLIVFRGEAFSKSPITSDYDLLKSHIDGIQFDDIPAQGTAIGSALATSVSRMRELDSKSKVIILLSDGEQTSGNIEPLTAAQLAYSFGIKVYTVGIGKKGKVPYEVEYQRPDFFAGKMVTEKRVEYQENTFKEKELRLIADKTGGKYFRATNNKSLSLIFESINELEKQEVKEERFKSTKDFYEPYLLLGILFFLLWLASKSTFLTSALHD